MKITALPLRLRLTLWYSLVFAVAFFGIGCSCLWMVHRAIVELENNELQQRVKSVRRFLEVRPKDERPAEIHSVMKAAYDVSHGSKWLQVIDQDGNWIYRNSHVAEIYPTLTLPQNLGAESQYFTYRNGDLHVRALIAPLEVNGRRYTVQTGLTLNKTLAILSNFQYQLALLTATGLLLSAITGYFMSRKALSPIAAIAAEAQRINDRNLSTRLPELDTHDELAALSKTLNQMLSRIEAGYQSVRSFTANAAHELRTPVALLRAETEVTLSFPRDVRDYRATCEKVLASSIQMSRLIDQMLMLARADAGAQMLTLEPLNLTELVEEVGFRWAGKFGEAGIDFEIAGTSAEFWTMADYISLKRLLDALLENAWRYTPSGRLVKLEMASEGTLARVQVTDTGVGISEGDQARIFERFFRSALPLHGEFAGSGLGLVLAQWIAERHGTTIAVHSSPGVGSRFSFELISCATPEARPAVDRELTAAGF